VTVNLSVERLTELLLETPDLCVLPQHDQSINVTLMFPFGCAHVSRQHFLGSHSPEQSDVQHTIIIHGKLTEPADDAVSECGRLPLRADSVVVG
jgi:hypothetical protein